MRQHCYLSLPKKFEQTLYFVTMALTKKSLKLFRAIHYNIIDQTQGPSARLVSCSDHGSDALMWAADRGDPERALLSELITLTGGAGINRETHLGDTALTIACSRQAKREWRGIGSGGGHMRACRGGYYVVSLVYPLVIAIFPLFHEGYSTESPSRIQFCKGPDCNRPMSCMR